MILIQNIGIVNVMRMVFICWCVSVWRKASILHILAIRPIILSSVCITILAKRDANRYHSTFELHFDCNL